MAKLTVKELEALTEADNGRRLYDDDNVRGEVRVNKSGISVAFSFRYRFNDKSREIRIGSFPKQTLKQIRENRKKAAEILVTGKDPALEKQIQKEQNRQAQENQQSQLLANKSRINVNQLFEQWEKLELINHKDGGKETRRKFEKDVLPAIGNMAVEDIKKNNVTFVTDNILLRGSNRMAKQILSLMRQMFRFAQDRDIIEHDPTSSIRKSKIGGKDTIRERYLSDAEIKELSTKLSNAFLLKSSEHALWISLSTCTRIGEICKAEWQHVNLKDKTWKIPKENSKNGKPHTIYLSNFAIKQFKQLLTLKKSDKWIYPNSKNTNHVCEKSITKQVGDRQLADNRKPMSGRTKYSDSLKLSNGKWTPQDLRRTGATIMGNLGVQSDVIEKCLNHIEQNKIKRTYQHQTLESEKKNAWDKLGEKIEHLTSLNSQNSNRTPIFL